MLPFRVTQHLPLSYDRRQIQSKVKTKKRQRAINPTNFRHNLCEKLSDQEET